MLIGTIGTLALVATRNAPIANTSKIIQTNKIEDIIIIQNPTTHVRLFLQVSVYRFI